MVNGNELLALRNASNAANLDELSAYFHYLEHGSTAGLTDAELLGIKKVDDYLALSKVNYGNQTAFDYYINLSETLDVSTAPNTAIFYSGKGNRELAEEFAKMNGKTTLEMTPGGAYLDNLKLFSKNSPLTTEEATNVWARLSARYAQNASGNIYGFC